MTKAPKELQEKLSEIERGLEGVTPGPWEARLKDRRRCYASIHGEEWGAFCRVVVRLEGEREDNKSGLANIAHIARLDPDTVRQWLTYTRELEAKLALIQEEASKDNSLLGRSDSFALSNIRTVLGVKK